MASRQVVLPKEYHQHWCKPWATVMSVSTHANVVIFLRITTSLLGGYVFTWGVTTFGVVGLVAAGVAYDEAYTLFKLLGFLIYLSVFLWAFAAASLPRVAGILFVGGAFMTALAWAIQNQLVQGV